MPSVCLAQKDGKHARQEDSLLHVAVWMGSNERNGVRHNGRMRQWGGVASETAIEVICSMSLPGMHARQHPQANHLLGMALLHIAV